MTKKFYLLLLSTALISCNLKQDSKANTELMYFDVKGYFGKEIIRLKKLNPNINKTVSINGAIENKRTKISDWDKELAIFMNADINKTSWMGNFKAVKTAGIEIFTSDHKKIPIKKISISKKDSLLSKIEIIINNKNILFQSQDTLTYIPDSLYSINKQQKIRFLSQKKYVIVGKFE